MQKSSQVEEIWYQKQRLYIKKLIVVFTKQSEIKLQGIVKILPPPPSSQMFNPQEKKFHPI